MVREMADMAALRRMVGCPLDQHRLCLPFLGDFRPNHQQSAVGMAPRSSFALVGPVNEAMRQLHGTRGSDTEEFEAFSKSLLGQPA